MRAAPVFGPLLLPVLLVLGGTGCTHEYFLGPGPEAASGSGSGGQDGETGETALGGDGADTDATDGDGDVADAGGPGDTDGNGDDSADSNGADGQESDGADNASDETAPSIYAAYVDLGSGSYELRITQEVEQSHCSFVILGYPTDGGQQDGTTMELPEGWSVVGWGFQALDNGCDPQGTLGTDEASGSITLDGYVAMGADQDQGTVIPCDVTAYVELTSSDGDQPPGFDAIDGPNLFPDNCV